MPLDEQIMKKTEIQKITNRYQDVNENEVIFRWKIPVEMAYEKQIKDENINHQKNGHNTATRHGLDEKIQTDNRKDTTDRN